MGLFAHSSRIRTPGYRIKHPKTRRSHLTPSALYGVFFRTGVFLLRFLPFPLSPVAAPPGVLREWLESPVGHLSQLRQPAGLRLLPRSIARSCSVSRNHRTGRVDSVLPMTRVRCQGGAARPAGAKQKIQDPSRSIVSADWKTGNRSIPYPLFRLLCVPSHASWR
jgi:hypothetical protein